MLFLDDFLEMLDELPSELKDRCAELRHLDEEVQAGLERNNKAILDYFNEAEKMTETEKQERYQQLKVEYQRLRTLAEDKVAIAERMQELVEKYVQHLEKEKTHFKYELEADNPGVTETIETRFSTYVQSVISMRKERKRKHTNGHVNGTSQIFNSEIAKPPRKIGSTEDFLLSSVVQSDLGLNDEDLLLPLALANNQNNGQTKVRKLDREDPVPRKRPSISHSLKTSLSVSSSLNGLSVSPAVSEKSWSGSVAAEDHSPNSSFLGNAFTHLATPSLSAFVGPESRHGRPRKLTSRVQEMFTEAVQRQRRHHSTTHPVELDGDLEENGDSDDAQKSWCFCGEPSYGEMVACDNKQCRIQWFHYGCVGIQTVPKGKWYCPNCSSTMEVPQLVTSDPTETALF